MGDLDNTDDSDIEIKYDLLLMIESSEESSDDHYLIDKVRAWVEIDSKVAPSQNWINFSFLFPAKDLKGRWRNLRDTYVKEKRLRKTQSGQAADKQKKWKFMDIMNFLDRFTEDAKYVHDDR